MDTSNVGSLSLSTLALGVGNITSANHARVAAVVGAALEAGVTYFDISNRPDSTEQGLADMLAGHRDEVVIGTKFGSRPRPGVLYDASPAEVRRSVEHSLRNLRTDRIDLLFLHRPDPATPFADTLGALDELVQAGKVREVACSKFTAEQLRAADQAASDGVRFVAVENACNLLCPRDVTAVMPTCADLGLAYLAYWPLAAGLLTGKYAPGAEPPAGSRFATSPKWVERRDDWHTPENFARIEELTRWSAERDHTLVELAFGWLRARGPVATIIAGAGSPEQVQANAVAADAWQLSAAELSEIDRIVGVHA
jgi:aryl-alcohol dehydrogenase-like predicted oxidoreductase